MVVFLRQQIQHVQQIQPKACAHEKDSQGFYYRKNACIMKDQGKALQAIA